MKKRIIKRGGVLAVCCALGFITGYCFDIRPATVYAWGVGVISGAVYWELSE